MTITPAPPNRDLASPRPFCYAHSMQATISHLGSPRGALRVIISAATRLVVMVALIAPAAAQPATPDHPPAGRDEPMPKLTGLLFNQDCTDFFYCNAIREGVDGGALLDAYIDLLADAGVTVLMCNTNARRTNYRSDVWESFWDGYDPEGPDDQPFLSPMKPERRPAWRRMIHSMWALDRQGVDYPARFIARCRERGISPWISLRMNDVHENDNLEHPFHGALWRQEQYFRGGGGYYGRGLDYAHPEVRDTYRSLIEETLQRYDLDGLELDFMREPYLFRPGAEQEGAHILREWLRDIRPLVEDAARERGRPIRLGVRVPSRVEVALGWGLDAVGWADESLVDLVVATPRWSTLEYDMPLDEWREALAASGVTLAGGLEILHRPLPGGTAMSVTLEHAAGAATAVLSAGADAVYLFNYFPSHARWDPDAYRTTLRAMSSLEAVAALPRRHAVTWRDITGPQEAYRAPLPAEGERLSFRLATGPPPAEGALVTLTVQIAAGPATPAAFVNDIPCEPLARTDGDERTTVQYRVPPEALPGSRRDTIKFSADEAIRVLEVEVRIAPAEPQ